MGAIGAADLFGADPAAADGAGHLMVNAADFGAVGDGVADAAPALQAAIDAAGAGGVVWIPAGTYRVARTLVIAHDRMRIDGPAVLLGDVNDAPILQVQNVTHCAVSGSLFFDGQWRSGVVAIRLVGVLLSEFNVRADRVALGMDLRATSQSGASQNTSLNDIWLSIRNGIRGMRFEGDGTLFASNNRIHRVDWWGVHNTVSTGLDFVAYADNNYVDRAYLCLTSAGSTGVVFNSASPAADVQVYENHLDAIVESEVPGTVAVVGNRTWQTVGSWPTFARLRLSGSHPPALDIAPDSDVTLVNTNLGRGGLVVGQSAPETHWIPAAELTSFNGGSARATAGSGGGALLLGSRATSGATVAARVPEGWRRYSVVAYWTPTKATGGTVAFATSVTPLRPGGSTIRSAERIVRTTAQRTAHRLTVTSLRTEVHASPLVILSVRRTANRHDDLAATIALLGLMLVRTL